MRKCSIAGSMVLAVSYLAGCSTSGGSSAPRVDAASAEAACKELPQQSKLVATLIATHYVPAGTKRAGDAPNGVLLPGHCVVSGSIEPRTGADGKPYSTGFELSLPDLWNGRFLYLGGGGNDGVVRDTSLSSSISIGTPSPLSQGFAVVSTDAGHSGASATFGLDPRARVDHAFDSHYKTAVTAKALIAKRYGHLPAHSYFSGCSGGGRQGMMFSQRFPDLFDGITAGAPAMRVSSGATVAAMWNTTKFAAIAPKDATGQAILSRAFSNGDLDLVAKGINAACDAADGVADGMVQNIAACRFDPAVLRCQGEKTDACLSAAQVGVLHDVFAGPRNGAGKPLYAGQPWDPGIAAPGWRQWTLGGSSSAKPDSRYVFLMVDALVNEFFTPPDLSFDYTKFDFDKDPARMQWFSAIYDTYEDAQLAAFRQHGGKILFIHGMADPIFSAKEMLTYYERLVANNGGLESTKDFARAFVVPGMNHCSGGPSTDNFDSIKAMVDWVEEGRAPERIAAWAASNQAWFPNRTRPLCPYPSYARYTGSGSIEDAANFVCTQP
jgi:pimeloyl-ACP methyl ester carboxylesterase